MASITLNGQPLTQLLLTDAADATWVADVEYAADEAPSGQVTLSDGVRSMIGTVLHAGELAGLVRARVVGGRGGIRRLLTAAHFRDARVRDVLSTTLANAGESLAPSSSAPQLNTLLPHWSRDEGSCGSAISQLLAAHGLHWRLLDDGLLWAGLFEFPVLDSEALVLDVFDADGFLFAAPERLDLTPGVTFDGRRIRQAQYSMDEHLRARVWWY